MSDSHEEALQKKAQELAERAQRRRELFARDLEKVAHFSHEKIDRDTSPEVELGSYHKSAQKGLKRILAEAAARQGAALNDEESS